MLFLCVNMTRLSHISARPFLRRKPDEWSLFFTKAFDELAGLRRGCRYIL